MHELSLARDIVEMIYQNVPSEELNHVKSIVLKVGEFSGVVPDSLSFSYHALTSGTLLEKSELDIINFPFRIECSSCRKITSNEFGMMICRECGSVDTKIISGNELKIAEIILNEGAE